MEMVLDNGFYEMSLYEILAIDAGGLLDVAAAVGGAYGAGVSVIGFLGTTSLACAGTCAAIVASPVVAGTAVVAGVFGAGYSLYCLFN